MSREKDTTHQVGRAIPDVCAMDCEACKRKICTGATQIAPVGEEGGGQ